MLLAPRPSACFFSSSFITSCSSSGWREQIFLDDLLDLAALIGAEMVCARAGAAAGRARSDREQRGSEWAAKHVHGRSSFCDQLRQALCGGL